MLRLSYIFGILLISGCANLRSAQSPDFDKSEVQAGIFVSCNGYKTWQHCYDAAQKACPSGYSILAKQENLVMQARTLRIECKK
jgi:uncharacterized protein YceK